MEGKVRAERDRFDGGNIFPESGYQRREQITLRVQTKVLRSKWETGAVEGARTVSHDNSKSRELEALKRSVSVKERYKEQRNGGDEELASIASERCMIVEQEKLDMSAVKAAKERFQEGDAFRDNSASEKATEDIHFPEMRKIIQLFETGAIQQTNGNRGKSASKTKDIVHFSQLDTVRIYFERQDGPPKTADDGATDAEQKRHKLETEFDNIRIEKLSRGEEPLLQQRETSAKKDLEDLAEIPNIAEVRKTFEEGTAFKHGGEENGHSDRSEKFEIQVSTAEARQKFKQLDQQASREEDGPSEGYVAEKDQRIPVIRHLYYEDDVNLADQESAEEVNLLDKFHQSENGEPTESAEKSFIDRKFDDEINESVVADENVYEKEYPVQVLEKEQDYPLMQIEEDPAIQETEMPTATVEPASSDLTVVVESNDKRDDEIPTVKEVEKAEEPLESEIQIRPVIIHSLYFDENVNLNDQGPQNY